MGVWKTKIYLEDFPIYPGGGGKIFISIARIKKTYFSNVLICIVDICLNCLGLFSKKIV